MFIPYVWELAYLYMSIEWVFDVHICTFWSQGLFKKCLELSLQKDSHMDNANQNSEPVFAIRQYSKRCPWYCHVWVSLQFQNIANALQSILKALSIQVFYIHWTLFSCLERKSQT
jgi:hypothetical protein